MVPFGKPCQVRGKLVVRTCSKKIDLLLQRRWLQISTRHTHNYSDNRPTRETGGDRDGTGGEGVLSEIALSLVMAAAHPSKAQWGTCADIDVVGPGHGKFCSGLF
jgi:hypothetical protein